MFQEQTKCVEELAREFSERSARNSQYSLRSFAKSLDINHATLSLLLSGKRLPSRKMINKINQNFSVSTRSNDRRSKIMPLEQFETIATWVHYAILGLIHLEHFNEDSRWIAAKLKIAPQEARQAFEVLKQVGMIQMQKGKWIQVEPPIRIDLKKTSSKARNFIRGFLHKAEQQLDFVPVEKRDMTNITFAMNDEDVTWAKEEIKKFRRQLCHDLEKRNSPNRVYSLAIQLFPLSEP